MKTRTCLALIAGLFTTAVEAQTNVTGAAPAPNRMMISMQTTNDLGLFTNGPAVVQLFRITQSFTNSRPAPNPVIATNPYFMKMRQSTYSWTNTVFEHFIPGSLHYAVWTNFMALTNGRNLHIWSERTHPEGWPTNKPSVKWNTNSVLWGLKGLTALSPCWEGEGYAGQVPFTALTRRHAYTRGHGVGAEGFDTRDPLQQKVWFVSRNNSLVEALIKHVVIRTSMSTNRVYRDYTIVLFDRDLPESIEPMSVGTPLEVQSKYPFPRQVSWPQPVFQTEQGGYVSTGIAPLVVNTWKPGDSGCPNLIPLPGELVFFSGRSTSGPSPEMQQDMDELCRREKLDPKKYQMRRADLSKYPDY